MINPKPLSLVDQAGTERQYILGQIPYLAGGREVCSQYISTAAPKIGDYEKNQALAEIMFSHIAVVQDNGTELILTTKELVNNHVPDFVTGIRLEEAMLEHNVGFSVIGKILEYRDQWRENLPGLITRILTILRESLPTPDNAPSTNSEPSTPHTTQ